MSHYNDFYHGWPAFDNDNHEITPEAIEEKTAEVQFQRGALSPAATVTTNDESEIALITAQASNSTVTHTAARLPLVLLTPPPRESRPSVPIPIVSTRQPPRYAQIQVHFPISDSLAPSMTEFSCDNRRSLSWPGVTLETKVHDMIIWLNGKPDQDQLYIWSGGSGRNGLRMESSRLVPPEPHRAAMTLGEATNIERLAGCTEFLFMLEHKY